MLRSESLHERLIATALPDSRAGLAARPAPGLGRRRSWASLRCSAPASRVSRDVQQSSGMVNASRPAQHAASCEGRMREDEGYQGLALRQGKEGAMTAAVLGMLALPSMQSKKEIRYVRGPRRWLGLRGGRLMEVEHQPEQQWQQLPQEVWSQAKSLAPPEVWAALGGFLLSSALHALARWYKGSRQRRQQQHAQAAAAQATAQRSLAQQRGRFERVLAGAEFEPATDRSSTGNGAGELEGDPIVDGEHGLDDSSGVPDSVAGPAAAAAEPWQYDADAVREWESFVQKSKASQVSQWWDADDVDERSAVAALGERDWNA